VNPRDRARSRPRPGRSRRVRPVLVALLCVGAGVSAAVAVAGAAPPDQPASRQSALGSPGWSPRRVPQPFVDAVGGTRLQRQLDAGLGSGGGCFQVTTAAGPVAGRNEDAPTVGASTQKLLTGAAALAVLGPETTLRTRVLATGDPGEGAVDRLVLVGGGDPLLSTAPFRAYLAADPKTAGAPSTALEGLADLVAAKGIRSVRSLSVVDDRYDDERYNPAWSPAYRTEGQIGPVGALTVNRGFVRTSPPVAADDPAVLAGTELARLLRERGVAVGGTVQRGRVPDGAREVATLDSAPVAQLVAEVVRSSDNLASETLVKEMGVRKGGAGTTAAGLAVATRALADLGVPMTGVTLLDGSGLARDNRVTCRALTAAVDLGARPGLEPLWAGMAVAGQTGTLADEMRGGPLDGRLRGKTGFLNGVSGLAGLVDVGRPLRFSLIATGSFGEAEAIRIRARLAEAIGRFPEAPAPDALVPAPRAPTAAS
jgi:D-alanyl-D-alanine carboxypeptidase/D-alanyl-D-alanine-endopeptidase (penicillin-binding protein 4)